MVTDIRMEDIDGIEILEKVKARSDHTKVIMITGYATVEVAREALGKGAFDFIAKPFKPNDLREVGLPGGRGPWGSRDFPGSIPATEEF